MKDKSLRRDKLKWAIFKDGRKAYEIAAACGMNGSRLSRIVAGIDEPTPGQVESLCDELGLSAKGLGL